MQIQKPVSSLSSSALGWITLFSILLGIFLIPTLIILQLNQTLLNDDFYMEIIQKQQIKDGMSIVINNSISEGFNSLAAAGSLSQDNFVFPTQFVDDLVEVVIPEGWLEEQTQAMIESIMDFVNLRSDTFSTTIDLQPIKANIASPAGRQALLDVLTKLPVCTGEQLLSLLFTIQSGEGKLEFCSPPVGELGLVDQYLDPLLNQLTISIPGTMVFPTGQQAEIIEKFKSSPGFLVYRVVRQVMDVIPYTSLFFLVMIIILSIRSYRVMATAIGVPFFVAGIIIAIPGLWITLDRSMESGKFLATTLFSRIPEISELFYPFIREVMAGMGRTSIILGFGTLLAGVLLFLLRTLFKRT